MALKPDVTLSIVKNSNDTFIEPEKVYYSENVYRVDKGTHRFKEILQMGLELIGEIDTYSAGEVIMLAKMSLNAISERNILDISHMGFLQGLLENVNLSNRKMNRIIECIRSKNTLEMQAVCKEFGIDFNTANALSALTGIYGSFEKCIGELKNISVNDTTEKAVDELQNIYNYLKTCGCSNGINLDFSIVNDLHYYNGIIFNGFVEGVPNAVLSGGRYDNLMRKFGKKSGALGFGVYLDQLERLMCSDEDFDFDVLILYDDNADLAFLAEQAKKLSANGESVRVQKNRGSFRYKKIFKITGDNIKEIEVDNL